MKISLGCELVESSRSEYSKMDENWSSHSKKEFEVLEFLASS